MVYEPKPIPTADVELAPDLLELVEVLARHNHDHWARQRIDEGWTHGAARDDRRKTHPDLQPYERISESEKRYDRTSVIETLKGIVALGYEIRRRP